MKPLLNILRLWLVGCLVMAALPHGAGAQSDPPPKIARLGVLAFRGEDVAIAQWQPLVAYLGDSIDGWTFTLVPVTLVSAPEKLSNNQLDFLITNPGHYVTLAHPFGLSVLATRERRVDGTGLLRYGTVIFALSDSEIRSLDDVKGKRLAAVSPDAFGGFQLAWREFQNQEIHPFADLESIRFMGFPQDAIVMAVLAREVEAGVIRSGLLENMAAERRIDIEDFVVLQGNSQLDYPYKVSGALYPEWPFTSLPGIDKTLRENVSRALLATQNPDIARQHALGDIWSAPLSYENVRDLVTAYQDRRESSGISGFREFSVFAAGMLASFGAVVLYRRRWSAPNLQPASPAALKENDFTKQELDGFASLTKRERQVLSLICVGQSSRSIAEKLGISPKTVEYHRANLLQKTGAKSSAHLVQLATRLEHDLGFSLGESDNKHM